MITSSKEELHFKGSNILPTVIFNKEGALKIEGKIIPDNISSFFTPLRKWINDLTCSKVIFEINIEYMNTNASRELFHLLRALDENPAIQDIVVLWHYEEEDEEYYETGRSLATRFEKIKFNYISYVK